MFISFCFWVTLCLIVGGFMELWEVRLEWVERCVDGVGDCMGERVLIWR